MIAVPDTTTNTALCVLCRTCRTAVDALLAIEPPGLMCVGLSLLCNVVWFHCSILICLSSALAPASGPDPWLMISMLQPHPRLHNSLKQLPLVALALLGAFQV